MGDKFLFSLTTLRRNHKKHILVPNEKYRSNEGLKPFIYESAVYKKYFDNCGQSEDARYPVKNIVISYTGKKRLTQDHFEFLRTANGYNLISL